MSGHKVETAKRIRKEPVVLVPQDTTFLNFATDDKSKDMGTLRVKKSMRFRSESRMFNCIAVYMIIGWRLHGLAMASRRLPQAACSVIFSDKEWKILIKVSKKGSPLPDDPPSAKEMTRLLARLGGFLGRKGDGEPGVKTIWQGYNKLLHYIDAAEALGL